MEQNWQRTDNPLFISARKGENNLLVMDGDDCNSKLVAVYCSSNGIYFPNNDETFIKRITIQNKYDWKTNRFVGIRKHIYIRDIYKQWYVNGINEQYNSISGIAERIKAVAGAEARFVFLGSSAGAYMAIALSTLLGGIAFAGSPQIKLPIEDSRNWLLKENVDDPLKAQWYDLTQKITEGKSEIFILYGLYHQADCQQLMDIQGLRNVHLLPFRTKNHGVVFFSFNVPYFLKHLDLLRKISASHRPNSKIIFSMRLCGPVHTAAGCWKLYLAKRGRKDGF